MDRPNIAHLQTLAVVAELGSFSAAADRLQVTQPAVSFQIRQLERRLGVRLIERVGRRAAPTAAGTELLTHARHIDVAVTAAMDAMSTHSTSTAGRVRIGTGGTTCIHLLPRILGDVRRRFPSIELIVTIGNTSDVLKALDRNALDIGVVTLPARGRAFDVTPILTRELVCIAARTARLPARLTAKALAPLVHYETTGNTRRITDRWFARGGAKPKPVMELESIEAIKELVAAGIGAAVVPKMAVTGPGARKTLSVHRLTPRLYTTLGVVVRRDKPRQAAFREVLKALVSHAREHQRE